MTLERKTIFISSFTSVVLSLSKLTIGFMTGSMTVISSAMDSVLDFVVSIANYFVLNKSEKKQDKYYNFGYGKVQGFGALFEGLVIFIFGLFIIFFAIRRIINKELMSQSNLSIYVMLFSIVVITLLVVYMNKIFRKTNNLIIKSDLFHHKSDLYTDIGIMISLVIIRFTGLYFIDPIISIAVAGYIMYGSWEIIKDGSAMLLDKSLQKPEIDLIINILNNTNSRIDSFHALKTRRSGSYVFIELHLVFDTNISLLDAHNIGYTVEKKIKSVIKNSKILIHLDPFNVTK